MTHPKRVWIPYFAAAGIVMLALPGQGLLSTLVGLVVADFRKKRDLELALARHHSVMVAPNAVWRLPRRPRLAAAHAATAGRSG